MTFTKVAKRKMSAPKRATKFKPTKIQKLAIKAMCSLEALGVLLRPGRGKTAIVLHAFKKLREEGAAKSVLVVAKGRIITNETWQDEVRKWELGFTCSVLWGSRKDKNLLQSADIYLTTYDTLPWLEKKIKAKEFKPDMIVLDESSKIKNHNTNRFKTIKRLAVKFTRRYILTGTPIPNGYVNLFTQVYFLDFGERLTGYITHFRNRYVDSVILKNKDGQEFPKYTISDVNAKRIVDKVSDILIGLDDKEARQIPEPNIVMRHVSLPAPILKPYRDLEKDYITQFEDIELVAVNGAAKNMKMRQFASGFVYLQDKSPRHIHDEKIEELKEIVEEMQGDPLLVTYIFKYELDMLLKAFPGTPYVNSTVGAARGKEIQDQWNAGVMPLQFAETGNIAHGLNYQYGGCTLCMYTMTNDQEIDDQVIRRLDRPGQDRQVQVIRLIARDTVDEDLAHLLLQKELTQKDFNLEIAKRTKLRYLKRSLK